MDFLFRFLADLSSFFLCVPPGGFSLLSFLLINNLVIILTIVLSLLLFILGLVFIGQYKIRRKSRKQAEHFLASIPREITDTLEKQELEDLPEIVQRWLAFSGVVGENIPHSVVLRQRGRMRAKPKGRWMSFKAQQFFNVVNPAFLWLAEVSFSPYIVLFGKDVLVKDQGSMRISISGLINVVREENEPKVNSGAMTRFLAEMCWFPWAAANKYVKWKELDATSVEGTLELNSQRVSGVFRFNEQGRLLSFEAQRFYGGGRNAKKEKWFIQILSYTYFSKVQVPNRCKITWKFPEADFTWMELEVIKLVRDPA